jgi:ABC-type amino acid transport system permease subunit
MLLRKADLQSLLYMIVYPSLIAWQWVYGIQWYFYVTVLLLSVGLAVTQHNHTHLRMWRWKPLNRITDLYLSIIQATPTYVFFPSHIGNHHRYNHGPQDETRTYRFGGNHNHIVGYILHPFQALSVLIPTLFRYVRKRLSLGDYWPIIEFISIIIASSILAMIDFRTWLLLVLIPQMFGLHWLLAANYLQHAGAQPGTGPDAPTDDTLVFSRNFTGMVNLIWLNIGYHTAHHEEARAHWSDLPKLHEKYVHRVPSELIERSLFAYMIRVLIFRRPKIL